ncbi:MAG: DUF3261 domain-containing protein [Planctomycetes bacterium]|nr:DUF3261 domain-containing protein [Planctomycetota bacterium]MCB9934195.1 DUF3261 domain-containing protein [Planctomycetota bacterium]
MRVSAIIMLALLLAACAETDPYKRLEPAPTPGLDAAAVADAFNARWPEQFKCVQTVTLDFRVTTRTLMGYLIVQRPGRFRLQGMSEQGLKLFDIAFADGRLIRIFAAEEFDQAVLENIARDIERVFLLDAEFAESRTTLSAGGLAFNQAEVREGESGARANILGKHGELQLRLAGDPPSVDWYDFRQSDRSLYRVDQYEWKDFDGALLPSVIVLRERGVQSKGPPYKLTIAISEFTVRDRPWPDKTFQAKEGG